MKFESIDEIYATNEAIRKNLLEVVDGLTADEAATPTENGKWTISKIVEHLSLVDIGMTRISAKLLTKAKEKGLSSDGAIVLSTHFVDAIGKLRDEKTRLNAPDIVQPQGGQPISDSIVVLNANRVELNAIRDMFSAYDPTAFTFPHPAFGELTALDWLVLLGGHEARHTAQIERILSRKDAAKA